ncbi:MAG: type III pantothenate kinase [Desulfococcaceae bacterium]
MLLVIDVGNTNTVMGIYRGEEPVRDWRIRTERNTTEDEFNLLISGLFAGAGIQLDAVTDTIISSVVPPMAAILSAFCRKYLNHEPLWVDAKTAAGMPILYDNPREVGADRIVNAVAAYEIYRTALIIIDFGTATTFDAVSAAGEYLGGAISPGVGISAEALFMRASKLPRVDILKAPERVVGRDTIGSIQSGVIFGYAGLVEGIASRMTAEMGAPKPRIIATGGLAPLMADVCPAIEAVEPDLTLEGLRLIHQRVRDFGK